jgi:thiol-disulfide isomerase/thioredoxin
LLNKLGISYQMLLKTFTMTMAGTALLGVSCGEAGSDGTTVVQPAAQMRSDPGGSQGHQPGSGRLRSLPAPLKFEATTLDGRPFTGANLAERPVVFWFWAPWCPKCVAEGPHVADIAKKYGDRVTFVGIAGLDKSKEQMHRFVTRTGTGIITQLDDRTGRLWEHFGVTVVPSLLLVTTDGQTRRVAGRLGESGLEQNIRGLVGG